MKKEIKKRMCVCVVLCFVCSFIYVVLLKKKEYKMKYKKYVFFAYGQSVFLKIILDLITSLLNLPNLANIKTNREINSWELTINF